LHHRNGAIRFCSMTSDDDTRTRRKKDRSREHVDENSFDPGSAFAYEDITSSFETARTARSVGS
jgi:hypothetical protein